MIRILRKTLAWVAGTAVAITLVCAAIIAWPQPLFAYGLSAAGIEVRSDRPIPAAEGEKFLREVASLLDRSPLKRRAHPYTLYVANDSWRRRLVFLWLSGAGGVVFYPVSSRHGFLSGADFARGALVHSSGKVVRAPRTLAYYGAHELTHVVTGQQLGTVRFHLMPQWAREGFADYVALRDGTRIEELAKVLDGNLAKQDIWDRYGYYARYRLLVAYLLEREKWPVSRLLQTRMTYEEARTLLRNGLAKSNASGP